MAARVAGEISRDQGAGLGTDRRRGRSSGQRDIRCARTGIIVAGVDAHEHVYVLADDSMHGSPNRWARRAVAAYHRYRAEEIVAEGNQGGELVRLTLQTVDEDVPVQLVHATHGKRTRAEPVAALYEQGRVHHVGTFTALEDQLCLWDSTSGEISPDRLDALVWAVTELRVDAAPVRLITSDSGRNPHIRGPQLQTNAALSGWLRDLLGRDSARRTPTSDRADGGPSAMNEDDHSTHETAD